MPNFTPLNFGGSKINAKFYHLSLEWGLKSVILTIWGKINAKFYYHKS